MIGRHEMNPWVEEPPLYPEGKSMSWNVMSPEKEFCELVGGLVVQQQAIYGKIEVIETGVGQGFVTRRILGWLDWDEDYYFGYDTEPEFLDLVPQHVKNGHVNFYGGTPGQDIYTHADVVVLDSDLAVRIPEIGTWQEMGKRDSLMICHDVPEYANPDPALTVRIKKLEKELEIQGTFTDNQRGGWYGIHP